MECFRLAGGMNDGDAANAYHVAMNLTRSVQFLQQQRPRQARDGNEQVRVIFEFKTGSCFAVDEWASL